MLPVWHLVSSVKVARRNLIGYYPATEQITIPHFDADNRLVGIRGRFLGADMADRFGKYRPLVVNGIQYSHPLSMNLYNLNNSKENISQAKVAVVYESEKSCMKHSSFYGAANDISVACCGSNLSAQQVVDTCQIDLPYLRLKIYHEFPQDDYLRQNAGL